MTRTLAYDLEVERDEALAIEAERRLEPALNAVTLATRGIVDAVKLDLGHKRAVYAARCALDVIWDETGAVIEDELRASDDTMAALIDSGDIDVADLVHEAVLAGIGHDDKLVEAWGRDQ